VQYYLNAADVLIVQRWNPLNSSNLILGMTFGKVVIGPNTGNVQGILKATGNPVFDQCDEESVVQAITEGLRLSGCGLGDRNREYAMQVLNPERVAQAQIDVYTQLLSQSTGQQSPLRPQI